MAGSPDTFKGTELQSVKKNLGKAKIKTTLGTEHIAKASKKSAFKTKGSSKRHKAK